MIIFRLNTFFIVTCDIIHPGEWINITKHIYIVEFCSNSYWVWFYLNHVLSTLFIFLQKFMQILILQKKKLFPHHFHPAKLMLWNSYKLSRPLRRVYECTIGFCFFLEDVSDALGE